MRIIKLNKTSYNSVLKLVKEILADGGVVVGPSDTVYGLYCKASDDAALKKIFKLKSRPKEKALPIFVKDIKMAQVYAEIPEKAVLFLRKIWPGTITTVFYVSKQNPPPLILREKQETIAIRMPAYKFLLDLTSVLGEPIAQTSANISGKEPARNVTEILDYFQGSKIKPELVIDAGEIMGVSSTVIDLTQFNKTSEWKILREGTVSRKEIQNILKKLP